MSFRIKVYRWPENDNEFIIIGLGQVEVEGGIPAIPQLDERLYQNVKPIFTEGSAPDTAFVDMVRKTILEFLKEGTPQLGRVANAFGLGPRTLERRLSKTGIDFTKLVDDTRRGLALDLLSDPQNKLTNIALLLGYSEVSAFNRAFKRWTNCTPLNFRRVNLCPRRKSE